MYRCVAEVAIRTSSSNEIIPDTQITSSHVATIIVDLLQMVLLNRPLLQNVFVIPSEPRMRQDDP